MTCQKAQFDGIYMTSQEQHKNLSNVKTLIMPEMSRHKANAKLVSTNYHARINAILETCL